MKVTRLFETDQAQSVESITQEIFIEMSAKHKALLLQADDGNEPFTLDDFATFAEGLGLTHYEYVGGAAPRRLIPTKANIEVFTANEAPPDQLIPFHHELAQVKNPPQYLFFYCDLPSETGGETALIDSTLVYRYVAETFPEFMDKLKTHGARYKRVLPTEDDKESPIGRSFYSCYQVDNKADLEAKLNDIDGLEYKWMPDGCLQVITEPIPAIRMIEQQHEHGIYQWTFHNSVIAAFVGWQDCRNDRLKSICFGNNDEMDLDVLQSIANFMEDNKISYKWKKGDIFALNNRLVMHSRNAYTGARRVYAAMFGDAIGSDKVKRDGVGQAITDFSALSVSDPTTFGMWRLDNPEETVYNAIKAGYRRFDSACDYGNETETGKGIRRAINEGIVKREDLYITTKLWNTYHAEEHVPLALDKCLKDLGLDYVDEFLIHFPISMEYVPIEKKYPPEWTNLNGEMVLVKNDINATWRAMERLVEAGKTRHIGLSNFNCQHIRQVLSVANIRPTSLQVECHPHLSQVKLLRFVRESGIRMSAFSVMGGTSYISLGMATETDLLFEHPIVLGISQKHQKTAAQVLLRWAIQRNTLPINKSSSLERMKENRALFDFYLTFEDMTAIDGMNKNRRYNDPGDFCEPGMGTFCPIYE
ncbi:hypothetical protein ACHAWO_012640 [Cyclotella atomus]|uniref:NADP-dependent oxidoreductase domain-containing protein n=1 Tax=Cyclotella atomus TaxID=382360 RepID=A0ABD3N8A0_9STRA